MYLAIDAQDLALRTEQHGAVVERLAGALLHAQDQVDLVLAGEFLERPGGGAGHGHRPFGQRLAANDNLGSDDKLWFSLAGGLDQACPTVYGGGHVAGQVQALGEGPDLDPLAASAGVSLSTQTLTGFRGGSVVSWIWGADQVELPCSVQRRV